VYLILSYLIVMIARQHPDSRSPNRNTKSQCVPTADFVLNTEVAKGTGYVSEIIGLWWLALLDVMLARGREFL